MKHNVGFMVRWALVGSLVFLAGIVHTPMLFAVRGWDAVGVITLALLFLWYEKRHTGKSVASYVLVGIVVFVLTREMAFYEKKKAILSQPVVRVVEKTVAKESLYQQLGKHIIVGYTNMSEIAQLARSGGIAGVFVTKRNVVGKTKQELAAEIANIQHERLINGLPKLIVVTDQEGGGVARLSPPLAEMGLLADATTDDDIRAYAASQAAELADVGITMNFAPVVDVARPEIRYHGGYTLIATRVIGKTPEEIAHKAIVYGQALGEQGVVPIFKHFPGLGRVPQDTHLVSARLDTSLETLTITDWIPFRAVATQSGGMMLSHTVLSSLDSENPVSCSKKAVALVRDTWNYQGVLVTDDLSMGAACRPHGSIGEGAVQSLNAGVDYLLIAYDTDIYYDVMNAVSTAWDDGVLDKDMILASEKRIQKLGVVPL